jgi:DNA integrity scanning protein DisA with diadenylate cyclase activity
MVVPKDPIIREAIYQSVLDASFERTGACIGIVKSGSSNEWASVIAQTDQLQLLASDKARALNAVINNRKFHELERTLRQEILAIDGATLIDHKGEILAIGAVVRIRGGSDGGGRTAAAEALAKFGLGIKISQDGSITGYLHKSARPSKAVTAFRMR